MSNNSGSGAAYEYPGVVVIISFREVSPELAEVLPIQGLNTCIEEEIATITCYNGLGLVGSGPGSTSSSFGDALLRCEIKNEELEVIAALRNEFPSLDVAPLEVKFFLMELEMMRTGTYPSYT
ncbi:Uncharacterized protein Adt_35080 [Abeliophyllum distichum]|uniref:Uncharacterized protein n=1 Tax=Abeliophyllum distichum TaxID=126358 RepID=A0ABD1QEM8_9LAMI